MTVAESLWEAEAKVAEIDVRIYDVLAEICGGNHPQDFSTDRTDSSIEVYGAGNREWSEADCQRIYALGF